MPDLIEECISDLVTDHRQRDYNAFTETFCVRCRQPECERAKWAVDKFGARVSTQYDRFFTDVLRAKGADDPRFANIPDFHEILREAVALSGGWDMPEVLVNDGQEKAARPSITSAVDDAVRELAKARGTTGPNLPEPSTDPEVFELPEADPQPEMRAPEQPEMSVPEQPKTEAPSNRNFGNTPNPQGGIILGGGPEPSPQATGRVVTAQGDDWTPKSEKVVKPGATIQMGGKND